MSEINETPAAEEIGANKKRVRRDIFGFLKSPVFGICVTVIFALGVVMLPGADLGMLILGKAEWGTQAYNDAYSLGNAIFRTIAVVLTVLLLVNLDLKIFSFKRAVRSYLFCLPFLAVVINNLPLVGFATKSVTISAGAGSWALYIFNCLTVGAFEELIFRGTVLTLLLRVLPRSRKGAFGAVMISSAVFGLMHLVNLISNPAGAVFMQVGYSFLIGAMCALSLLLTRNIFTSILLHAGFNICGLLEESLNEGAAAVKQWPPASIALTAVVGVIVAGYGVFVMLRAVKVDELKLIFTDGCDRKTPQENSGEGDLSVNACQNESNGVK